jgi:hypothetical protein
MRFSILELIKGMPLSLNQMQLIRQFYKRFVLHISICLVMPFYSSFTQLCQPLETAILAVTFAQKNKSRSTMDCVRRKGAFLAQGLLEPSNLQARNEVACWSSDAR